VPQASVNLRVVHDGDGTGSVDGTGIACGTACTAQLALGSTVTLSAEPESGSEIAGWSVSECNGRTCTVVLLADRTVGVTFRRAQASPRGPLVFTRSSDAPVCATLQPHLDVAAATIGSSCTPHAADAFGHVEVTCVVSRAGEFNEILFDAEGHIVRIAAMLGGKASVDVSTTPHGFVLWSDRTEYGVYYAGSLIFANRATLNAEPGIRLTPASDFDGGGVVLRTDTTTMPWTTRTWQRFDDLANALTPALPVPPELTSPAASFAKPDVRGNVLAVSQATPDGVLHAHWFDENLAPIGPTFPLSSTWVYLRPLARGGFALTASPEASAEALGAVRPGDSRMVPLPAAVASRRAKTYELVFSGDAFAFFDPCTDASCAARTSAEIVAADGTSCGVLRVREGNGADLPFFVTRSGTVIDTGPAPPAAAPSSRRIRWWPNVLR